MKTLSNLKNLSLLAVAFALSACDPPPKSGKGMHLPEGDSDEGKVAFEDLQCTRCHSVTGVELSAYEGGWEEPLELGGTVIRVKTYGDLVTAIANPDHVISEKYQARIPDAEVSPMPSLIEEMSVGQLIDLVTFLHTRYKKLQPEYSYEPYFY